MAGHANGGAGDVGIAEVVGKRDWRGGGAGGQGEGGQGLLELRSDVGGVGGGETEKVGGEEQDDSEGEGAAYGMQGVMNLNLRSSLRGGELGGRGNFIAAMSANHDRPAVSTIT